MAKKKKIEEYKKIEEFVPKQVLCSNIEIDGNVFEPKSKMIEINERISIIMKDRNIVNYWVEHFEIQNLKKLKQNILDVVQKIDYSWYGELKNI